MAVPIVMPSFGMYTADGALVAWLHPPGAKVKEGEPVLEIETDKAVHDVAAPASGCLHHVLSVGAKLTEQMVIGYVLAEGEKLPVTDGESTFTGASSYESSVSAGATEAAQSGKAKVAENRTAVDPADDASLIKASPIARRLAREHGISLAGVRGSGPGGRIVEADVLAADRAPVAISARNPTLPIPWRVSKRVRLTGMRRTIAERLKQSQNSAVALTLTREVRADRLLETRAQLNEKLDVSVPVDAFFVKFLALALRERPELNAVIIGEELLLLDEVHIGFACAVPGGLIVPVVRDADKLNLAEVGRGMRELAEKASAGRIKAADTEGGVSTLSNLGGFGVDGFTPVLNPPQSSILGVGSIVPRPVSDSGNVRVLPTVWLSLTFDHRVTDGVPAAQLLDSIARQMQDVDSLRRLTEN